MEIRPALAPYVPLARMLAQTFGQDCEVVLHDLDCPEHSVVHVENPSVTGRKVGQSFDQLVRQVILSDELKEDFVANYYFTAPNGKRIRSSTLLIRDGDGRLTGALCLRQAEQRKDSAIHPFLDILTTAANNRIRGMDMRIDQSGKHRLVFRIYVAMRLIPMQNIISSSDGCNLVSLDCQSAVRNDPGSFSFHCNQEPAINNNIRCHSSSITEW